MQMIFGRDHLFVLGVSRLLWDLARRVARKSPPLHRVRARYAEGLSQIAVTMNVYSEVSSPETRAALERLGEELEGPQAGCRLLHFAAAPTPQRLAPETGPASDHGGAEGI
jgi:hypothetical protein